MRAWDWRAAWLVFVVCLLQIDPGDWTTWPIRNPEMWP